MSTRQGRLLGSSGCARLVGVPQVPLKIRRSLFSSAYITQARHNCLLRLTQLTMSARRLALFNAGSSSAARMAMMAMTTSSSIKVKPDGLRLVLFIFYPEYALKLCWLPLTASAYFQILPRTRHSFRRDAKARRHHAADGRLSIAGVDAIPVN